MTYIFNVSLCLGILLFTFYIDQYTKRLFTLRLKGKKSVPLIGKRIKLIYLSNPGATLGLLKRRKKLLNVLTIVILIFAFVWLVYELFMGNLEYGVALSFIVSGGVSNWYERYTKGSVTDFLGFGKKRSLVFNYADFMILAGSIILILI